MRMNVIAQRSVKMSYSRWGNSCWYTYWSCASGDDRDNQVFEICDFARSHQFTYRELSTQMDECIEQVKQKDLKKVTGKFLKNWDEGIYEEVEYETVERPEREYEELKTYMQAFCEDVIQEYPYSEESDPTEQVD
jgi:hypothetical protein